MGRKKKVIEEVKSDNGISDLKIDLEKLELSGLFKVCLDYKLLTEQTIYYYEVLIGRIKNEMKERDKFVNEYNAVLTYLTGYKVNFVNKLKEDLFGKIDSTSNTEHLSNVGILKELKIKNIYSQDKYEFVEKELNRLETEISNNRNKVMQESGVVNGLAMIISNIRIILINEIVRAKKYADNTGKTIQS